MASAAEQGKAETVGLPAVGAEGDTCAQCGSALATDQRYCVNCGWRRGEARVDYSRQVLNGAQAGTAGGPPAQAAASSFMQSPIFAVGTIALLGIMLLLGVLIGKDNDNGSAQTVAAAPAQTTSTPTTTTPTADAGAAKAGKAAAAGQGNIEKGGSGSTAGVATADTQALENAAQNGQGAQAGKNLPNQVATGGQQEATDPEGIKNAGGNDGSPSACIGC
jgi:hypothetical protein